jgi:hypothetical protein
MENKKLLLTGLGGWLALKVVFGALLLLAAAYAAVDVGVDDLMSYVTAPALWVVGSYDLLGLLVLALLCAVATWYKVSFPVISGGTTLVIALMGWYGFLNAVMVIALIIIGSIITAAGVIRITGADK